jgi:hypothetical protein
MSRSRSVNRFALNSASSARCRSTSVRAPESAAVLACPTISTPDGGFWHQTARNLPATAATIDSNGSHSDKIFTPTSSSAHFHWRDRFINISQTFLPADRKLFNNSTKSCTSSCPGASPTRGQDACTQNARTRVAKLPPFCTSLKRCRLRCRWSLT